MKAVLQYRASPGFRRRLAESAPSWLRIAVVDDDERAAFATEIADADVLLHVLTPVTAAVMDGAPNLSLIQKIGVGVNTIDLDAARQRGIAVANMPGTNSAAVAELALGLMLAVLRRIPALDHATRRGAGWKLEPAVADRTGEIGARTVGLVGYGEVARRLGPVLAALGARVRYTATAPKPDAVGEWRALDELLAESDIVSLHLPLTRDTDKLVDARRLGRFKPGAVLINTARGALVDEAALIAALMDGTLGGAGLDVFEVEPVASDSPLLGLDNVVVTPHLAWLTPETLDRSMGIAIENCRRIRDTEALLHRVV